MTPTNPNKCDCKELTCPKGCKAYHTHKTFFCEKCEPEKSKELQRASKPTPTPLRQELREAFRPIWNHQIAYDDAGLESMDAIANEISDWWLSKISSRDEELLRKIKEIHVDKYADPEYADAFYAALSEVERWMQDTKDIYYSPLPRP